MNILVINAGSSSLKYQLFDMDTESVLAKGLCERIGLDGHLKHTPIGNGKPVFDEDVALKDHSVAIQAVIDKLVSEEYGVVGSMSEIDAVGHRVVHGGESFNESTLITDDVLKAIEDCIPLAPLHNPANITGIKACQEVMGADVPQIAVFDTAFHQTMPEKAYMYPIPTSITERIRSAATVHGTSTDMWRQRRLSSSASLPKN
jgi:acetate kinase